MVLNELKLYTCLPAFITVGRMQDQAGALQQQDPQELEPEVLQEVPMPDATAAAADIDLPEHTANDVFMLEEEVEVER